MANNVQVLAAPREADLSGAKYAESLADALRRAARGDREAFEDVYRRTSAKLFGVCLRILPGRTEAEDALQDVYCAVWRSAALFDAERGTAMTWLITLARNRAIDLVRRSKPRAMGPIEWASEVADPRPLASETMASDEEHRTVHSCLDLLSDRDADALKKAFFGGVTYADLAEAACIPIGTMKSRMRRALVQLRVAVG